MRPLSDESIKFAVEITKVAVAPTGPGTHHIGNQDGVAKFLEVVANKLEDLRIGPEKR
jgi:hypothetical protein